ncbi:serine hydrolase domain-containing protein [Algoriphagus hitonicola]|uniref:CubicO group peptidase, beta-lactamase class C family n=1 Tax=Algoriphagus hitonicola TaxID=435880 RepID=A0A1I2R193_9BACT|nr:serine hydrolase [Algoriphagus hitonicola]SFG33793.1 CubicO group peptidase, beta-lactamase class C family [Algoriphagus hitonicola]
MKTLISALTLLMVLTSCSNGDNENIDIPPQESSNYFPPLNSDEWESISPMELGWDAAKLDELLNYLETNHTRAFIILKDGKLVVEEYFGNNILGTAAFNKNSQWYWASAGKTLTATLVGIAQEEGMLSIEDPSSVYLGEGWTSLAPEKEQLITVKNQLTMTTGLEYEVSQLDCTLPACLTYRLDAGQQWFYHNAPYSLLRRVVENATDTDYNEYTDLKVESKIGMNGQWIAQDYNTIYWSTARDMARFGLLLLNKGKWDETAVLSDLEYYNQMVNTSQTLNPSYGYLWWLNGKESIIFPSIPNSFNTSLSENAPQDLVAGMGKNGQFVEFVPSKNLVVIRMGEAPDGSLVPITFHDEVWEKLDLIIN